MDLFGTIETTFFTERGTKIPAFVFPTTNFKHAKRLLNTFTFVPLTLNIPFLKTLQNKHHLTIVDLNAPVGTFLKIEWSFDDIDPDHAWETYVTRLERDRFVEVNNMTNSLVIILKAESNRTEEHIVTIDPYKLDWSGTVGLGPLFRMMMVRPDGNNRKLAESYISLITSELERGNFVFPATGLYNEVGFTYRWIDEWEQAIIWYKKEVQFALQKDGKLGSGCVKALCGLGVIYKKQGQFKIASDYLRLATFLNPNYYEALVTLAGLQEDDEVALKCLGRAYRIREQDSRIWDALRNISEIRRLNYESLENKLLEIAKSTIVSTPLAEISIAEAKPYLQRLGII